MSKTIKDRVLTLCDIALSEWRCVSKSGNRIVLNKHVHYITLTVHRFWKIVDIQIDEDTKTMFNCSYGLDKQTIDDLVEKINARDCEVLEELLNGFGV